MSYKVEFPLGYVYIKNSLGNLYNITHSSDNTRVARNVPFEFINALLTKIQLIKFKKGNVRFIVDWDLYYKVMYEYFRRYIKLECVIKHPDKYYVIYNIYSDSGRYGINFDIPYDKREDFNKEDYLKSTLSTKVDIMSGEEIIRKSRNDIKYFGRIFYTLSESQSLKEELLGELLLINTESYYVYDV